ncbi:HAD hydrolase-like protein [Patescibacteria group bacterium]|nr:HAD hydrolase-like protein [Patescibacteria group bacterium]
MKKIIIFDFNRTIYDPESRDLIVDARLVLRTLLKRGFDLYLISRAENSRKKLIDELGVIQYFTKIIIVKEKNKRIFQKIIAEKNVDLQSSFIIGDRIKKEIIIGNILGLQTIWLQDGKFSNELPSTKNEQPKYVVKKLKDVLNIAL